MTDSVSPPQAKRESLLLNIALNVLIPSVILMKGGKWTELSDEIIVVIALAFPVCYGIYDFAIRGKFNFISVLGFVSVLISGGVKLLELPKEYIAIKEAAIPGLIGIAVIVSLWTPFPLIRSLLYSPDIFDVSKIEGALKQRQTQAAFDRLMTVCTLYLAASFAISAILNYGLAKYFIRSETDTPQFNEEFGRMTLWSYPVIVVPCIVVTAFALWHLIKGIQKFTGYEIDDVLMVGRRDQEQASNGDSSPEKSDVEKEKD